MPFSRWIATGSVLARAIGHTKTVVRLRTYYAQSTEAVVYTAGAYDRLGASATDHGARILKQAEPPSTLAAARNGTIGLICSFCVCAYTVL